MNIALPSQLPIGIFDSGVGGLTVVQAIRQRLPQEPLLYLGDTARLPYGTKSPKSIARYAAQAAEKLRQESIKMLVVACNTASAVALPELRTQMHPIPVVGVVEPGALAAVAIKKSGRHWVLATEATVRLQAYAKAIQALDADAEVNEHACELLVSLAEEGWIDGAIATSIVRRYLDEAGQQSAAPDAIILGCTHFPLLRNTIVAAAGPDVAVVDSAGTTAEFVHDRLMTLGLLTESTVAGTLRIMATDGATRFARVGGQFLGQTLDAAEIELVDL